MIVIGILGEIPEENSHPNFEYENLLFTVEGNNEKIITSVRVKRLPPPQIEEEAEETDA